LYLHQCHADDREQLGRGHLRGTEQSAESRPEWQAVSLAALPIAFHLGRLSKLGQLEQWLAAAPTVNDPTTRKKKF